MKNPVKYEDLQNGEFYIAECNPSRLCEDDPSTVYKLVYIKNKEKGKVIIFFGRVEYYPFRNEKSELIKTLAFLIDDPIYEETISKDDPGWHKDKDSQIIIREFYFVDKKEITDALLASKISKSQKISLIGGVDKELGNNIKIENEKLFPNINNFKKAIFLLVKSNVINDLKNISNQKCIFNIPGYDDLSVEDSIKEIEKETPAGLTAMIEWLKTKNLVEEIRREAKAK